MTFITFEGPEGAGKSTQIKILAEHLARAGHHVALTREPGGTAEAEALRALLLDPAKAWSPLAEALLMNAARVSHLEEVVLPALAAGKIVLCDRFFDSTRAYQHTVDENVLKAIHGAVVREMPDLTILVDVPVAVGLSRAEARGAKDRFEAKGRAFHEEVRRAFLDIAESEPQRFEVIDGAGEPQNVTAAVIEAVNRRLPGLLGGKNGDHPA